MKRSTIVIAIALLVGNLLVFEWIAWQVFSGQLEPAVDPDTLQQPLFEDP